MKKSVAFMDKLNGLLSPLAAKLGNQRHLKVISMGMMFGLPFIMSDAGVTMGLVVLMMRSKVSEFRTIGQLSFISGRCSIDEPVIFGMPIVFKPILAFPFLVTPIVNSLLTYFTQKLGFIVLGFIIDPSFTPFVAL